APAQRGDADADHAEDDGELAEAEHGNGFTLDLERNAGSVHNTGEGGGGQAGDDGGAETELHERRPRDGRVGGVCGGNAVGNGGSGHWSSSRREGPAPSSLCLRTNAA